MLRPDEVSEHSPGEAAVAGQVREATLPIQQGVDRLQGLGLVQDDALLEQAGPMEDDAGVVQEVEQGVGVADVVGFRTERAIRFLSQSAVAPLPRRPSLVVFQPGAQPPPDLRSIDADPVQRPGGEQVADALLDVRLQGVQTQVCASAEFKYITYMLNSLFGGRRRACRVWADGSGCRPHQTRARPTATATAAASSRPTRTLPPSTLRRVITHRPRVAQ
jgi:hypothetical protein